MDNGIGIFCKKCKKDISIYTNQSQITFCKQTSWDKYGNNYIVKETISVICRFCNEKIKYDRKTKKVIEKQKII